MAKVLIVYATRTGNTGIVAQTIGEGARMAGAEVVLKEAFYARNEDLDGNDGLLVGSPTYYREMVGSVNEFLRRLKPDQVKGRVGGAFGSCGFNGEAIIKVDEILTTLGMEVIKPGLRIKRRPDEVALEQCRAFGKTAVKKIQERSRSW